MKPDAENNNQKDKRNKVKITLPVWRPPSAPLLSFLLSEHKVGLIGKSAQPPSSFRNSFSLRTELFFLFFFLPTAALFDQEQREIRKLYLIYLHPSLSF